MCNTFIDSIIYTKYGVHVRNGFQDNNLTNARRRGRTIQQTHRETARHFKVFIIPHTLKRVNPSKSPFRFFLQHYLTFPMLRMMGTNQI